MKKKIFIGRFQPFHKGHLEAVKWIAKNNGEIVIVIGSAQEFATKENPFSFNERKTMVQNALLKARIKKFSIFGVPDFIEDDTLWVKKILEITKSKPEEIEVFTRNAWTEYCFKKLGAKVTLHPVFLNGLSGTMIRKKIVANKKWQNLVPEPVLRYLKKNKGKERIKSYSVLPEKKIVSFIKDEIKNAGARGAIMGISGGIDSSVTACLAKKALREKIVFVQMPFFKTCPLINNADLLKKHLSINTKRVYLGDVFESFLGVFSKTSEIAKENLKSRLKMTTLYYFAEESQLLVIGAINKSELESGFFTKYGDGGVDIFPLGDLYKTEVIEMAKRLKLPQQIIETIPIIDFARDRGKKQSLIISYQRLDTILKFLDQGNFSAKEISFLTDVSFEIVKEIIKRKKNSPARTNPPIICKIKN
ncbi:MAG TPA: NAD(+) synthase [Candidatus Pacearchaeota archaeon]|nr:NAD(+) synthase [Candidatus Pacearchaeota archaeon]HPZ74325.1 NAD(+) synthase [Candidatus Pacearchaeota archaeon]HQD88930.1 NAD(+) synthase [Candidatus Pacearchaeota archaeon]